MTVYLAWYYTGFSDEGPALLGVHATQALADAAVEDHKVNGDRRFEYGDKATWRVTPEEVKGADTALPDIHPDSPEVGDIVACTNKEKRLKDPQGYRVEVVGRRNGMCCGYGTFAARGVRHGGLYVFKVDEYTRIGPTFDTCKWKNYGQALPKQVKAEFTPGPIPGSGRPNLKVTPDTVTVGGFVESDDGMVVYLSGWSGQDKLVTGNTSRVAVSIPLSDLYGKFKHRYDIDTFPGNTDIRLPYEFDLVHDVKWMSDLVYHLDFITVRNTMKAHGITVKQARDAYKAYQAWAEAESSRALTDEEKVYGL